MKYENRQPKEGINVSSEHPLKQFVQLLAGAALLIVVTVVILQFAGSWLAKRIPFEYELKVMDVIDMEFGDVDDDSEIVVYLNELATRLHNVMEIPAGMQVQIHYSSDDVFNAFATVGGNLLFYKGLLKELPSENALAMVMAHEIAHVLHRDPVAGLGGGVASSVAMIALTGNAGTGTAASILRDAGMVTNVQFTRNMEKAADAEALAAVNRLYGHVAGADSLFRLIDRNRGVDDEPTGAIERFTTTHPAGIDRVAAIKEQAEREGWSLDGELSELPVGFPGWL